MMERNLRPAAGGRSGIAPQYRMLFPERNHAGRKIMESPVLLQPAPVQQETSLS